MCTSIAMNGGHFYFGRNLDLECGFGERIAVTPRRYPIALRCGGELKTHYAMIGMATVVDGYPLYAEAVNEKGLAIAGLNFPENAYYPPRLHPQKRNITPYELPLALLGNCATLEEAKKQLSVMQLVGMAFSEKTPLSPLHWHVADKTGSAVIECTRSGMHIYDNPAGVLTNNPPFDFQMINLNQYLGLTNAIPENHFGEGLELKPFGRGMGAIGLPGDFSPVSRFVKAAFLLQNSDCPREEDAVAQFFHLLDAVAMPRGSVIAPNGEFELTRYSCCMDADEGIYYYKTYENSSVTAICMHEENLEGEHVVEYPLAPSMQIVWANKKDSASR